MNLCKTCRKQIDCAFLIREEICAEAKMFYEGYEFGQQEALEKLVNELGIKDCKECKFGGDYCTDCKSIDAHRILEIVSDIKEESEDDPWLELLKLNFQMVGEKAKE